MLVYMCVRTNPAAGFVIGDGAPAWGGEQGAREGERLVGLGGGEGLSNSCLCQHEDKCKEINSYLKSKWGHGIRLWHVSV